MRPLQSVILHLCGFAAIILAFSTAAYGQPAAPTDLEVIPRYTSPIVIAVQWQDNSNNEDGFRIERREEGTAAWTFWTTVAATGGIGQRRWIDNTAASDKMWEYHVCATSAALGNSAYTDVSHATSPRQEWPIDDGDRNILNNFGNAMESVVAGNFYFHAGVDISASGKQVNAGRGGIVTGVGNAVGGYLELNVDFGAGPEADVYAHVAVDPAWAWNIWEPIAPGERIGTVRDNHFDRDDVEAHHVHWGDGHMNNLIPYTIDANRDPNDTPPAVGDMDGDGDDFIVVSAAANDHASPLEPAWGDVDFLVDASDDMTPSFNINVAPFRIGYWIQSTVPGGENVRSSAAPYRLIQFDYPLTGPGPAGPIELACVYWDLPGDLHGIDIWQNFFTWIVTNTRGTDGSIANVDAAQFWRTDARKSTGAQPNGSDAQHARENQDAKFPDGKYNVHIIVGDLVHQSDHVRSIVVDNSRPYVKRVKISSGIQPIYLAQWVWNAAAAQLEIQPATFNSAAALSAFRTQDVTIEVEFSEPMQTATIESILPLGTTPTLISTQLDHERTIWKGIVSNLDIADDGSDDGIHMITFNGTDFAGNSLLQIHDRTAMGADHHNRDAGGAMRGTVGTDNIHGFRIGPLSGVLPVTAIFMKQTAADPATPLINDRTAEIQQALNTYFSEVSYSHISFSVTGHGWYQLAHPIDWYYTIPQTPLIDLVQETINAAQTNGVDLSTSNYILVVTDDADATHGEWSTNGGWPYTVAEAPGWRLIAGGTMRAASTDARITNLAGRWVGLIDLFEYPYVSTQRPFVGPWSHMSDRDQMVHVMGWEKWRAGWLDETGTATGETLTRVAKPPVATPLVNQNYTLLPLDLDNNGSKMVAIEAGDRLYYTAEYRRQQNLDAALPDGGVLIVKANEYVSQGEGPAIVQESLVTAGTLTDATFNLDASRTTFNDDISGINIEVTSMNSNQAEIRLNYEVPPTQNDVYVSRIDDRYQTEDIWIDAPDFSGNFEADPLTVKDANEKPVIDWVNKVHARVRNQGHADATNFEVQLGLRTPWGSGGPWDVLGVETVTLLQGQDHSSDAYFIISVNWTPSSGENTCAQVTVTGIANDINPENNQTQENIYEFVTSPGSPYAPVTSRFEVENPYNETLPVFFKLDGLPPSWSYILTPERLVIPSKGVGSAQVTIQPDEATPLCSKEPVTISAYVPQVDVLKRLGAITLQIALKNAGTIQQNSWVDCGKKGTMLGRDARTTHVNAAAIVGEITEIEYTGEGHGSITGKVSDKATDEPLAGANVMVAGTPLGAASDIEGYYRISNVPVGVHTVRSEYIGYRPVRMLNIPVFINSTSKVNFALNSEALELGVTEIAYTGEGHGSITGKVSDKATDEPLAGANVMVEGTPLGAASDAGGYYRISNVPVGVHAVICSYIGYESVHMLNVPVSINSTTEGNFALTYTDETISGIETSRCVLSSQGCTDPPLPNTEILVIYTAPDGTKAVHYVTTDANGCYVDMISAGEPGVWQTQAVLPETDCRAGHWTPPQTVYVRGPWRYFMAFGPNFPIGEFNDLYNPGFSLNFGAEQSIRSNLSLVALVGFHQFYSPDSNQYFVQASVNAKFVFFGTPERFAYVNAGPGVYKPRYGSTSWGGNIGIGMTWMIRPRLGIDLNMDYHLVNYSEREIKRAKFADIQIGIVWSF